MARKGIGLTDLTIRNLKTNRPQQDFFDEKFSGGSFMVRVSKTGRKSFVVAYRIDGQRRRLTLGTYPETSLTAARERARGIVAQVDKGVDPLGERKRRQETPTLREYYQQEFSCLYVENAGSVRYSTRDQYRWAFNKHILSSPLAEMRLDRIARSDVEMFVMGLVKGGFSRHSIQDIVKCLGKCFRWAVEHKVIVESPVAKISQLYRQAPIRKKEPNPFSREDALRFLQAAKELFPNDYYYLFLTALQTGLRSGELQALKWSDVDFENKWINVVRNHSHGQMNEPKTRKGRRTVDMSDALLIELQNWKRKQREGWLSRGRNEIPEWVFPNGTGNMLDFHNLKNRQYKRVIKRAGLRSIPFHSLRDTFATLLLMAGQPLSYVSAQLGHSNPKVTIHHYARWLPGSNRKAMNSLPSLISPSAEGSRQVVS